MNIMHTYMSRSIHELPLGPRTKPRRRCLGNIALLGFIVKSACLSVTAIPVWDHGQANLMFDPGSGVKSGTTAPIPNWFGRSTDFTINKTVHTADYTSTAKGGIFHIETSNLLGL